VLIEYYQISEEGVRRKQRIKWQEKWFLHQDNTLITISLCAAIPRQEKHSCPHPPPYPSDLAQNAFWLFLALQMGLMWRCFAHGGHEIECKGRTLKIKKKKPSSGASNNVRSILSITYISLKLL
jgi:hypothetical protein